MCVLNKIKEKPCIWVNYYRYDSIVEGHGVVYYKADGTKWMDRRVLNIISVNLEDNHVVIKVETETNVLYGVYDEGNGWISCPTYYKEDVM